MPIRKTSKGYYWGSKGPFPTRSKAEEVAKAAYSSGYIKNKDNEMPNPRMEDVNMEGAMGRLQRVKKMMDKMLDDQKMKRQKRMEKMERMRQMRGGKKDSMKAGQHGKKDSMKAMGGYNKKY